MHLALLCYGLCKSWTRGRAECVASVSEIVITKEITETGEATTTKINKSKIFKKSLLIKTEGMEYQSIMEMNKISRSLSVIRL